ncbi:AC9 transposase [Ceratobasidium sp. AG-Ba]|nr:AC9 transposase [Ceratobasidium sp. AG-Ba]
MAIACDAWTTSNRIAFLAIVGSWITDDWKLREVLLDFKQLHGPHDGDNMASVVADTLAELGIGKKVISLVSDNASNNNTLIEHISRRLKQSAPESRWDGTKGHIRCLAHVIHLAVMSPLCGISAIPDSTNLRDFDYDDKLFGEEIAEAIVAEDNRESFESDDQESPDPLVNLLSAICKVRKISKIVRSSPQRMELFKMTAQRIEDRNEQTARREGRPYIKKRVKTLILDVVTRWNSMLFMLERALEFREAIDTLTKYPTVKIFQAYRLSSDDWETVSKMCKWLKFFRDASLCVSGEKYPTLSFSLRVYFVLISYVTRLQNDSSVQNSPAALAGVRACREKLLQYFDQSTYDSEYYYFAMVLDPRYKDTLFKANSALVAELFSDDWVNDCASALVENGQEFYDTSAFPLPIKSEVVEPNIEDIYDFKQAFRASIPQQSGRSFSTRTLAMELKEYLSEDVIPDTQAPLAWWCDNAARFPRLARMARDYLCIPGSSVAVERVLSTGRDVISLRRPSMSADTIRTLMNYRADIFLRKELDS